MQCPYCGVVPNDPYPFEPHTSSCKHEVSFIKDVSVDAVMRAVEELLPSNSNKAFEQKKSSLLKNDF
jgi:hypothetical protein